MGAIDGLLNGKIDPNYDWTTFGNDHWESVGEDDGGNEHYYEKGSCYQQSDGRIWWLHRYGVPGESFTYLICFTEENSWDLFAPAVRKLSDPGRVLLEAPTFNLDIGRLGGDELAEAMESGIGLSPWDTVFPHVKLWGSVHSEWNTPPYVLFAESILHGATLPGPEAAQLAPAATHSQPAQVGWLKRLFGGATQPRTMLDEVEEKGSKLIVSSYRSIAKLNNCAPTSKTSDAQIMEVYRRIGTSFRAVASERGEHLPANALHFIVHKFLQVQEGHGQKMFDEHLDYELRKYRSEGLRPDYAKGLDLF